MACHEDLLTPLKEGAQNPSFESSRGASQIRE